jgi:hypothetical protein
VLGGNRLGYLAAALVAAALIVSALADRKIAAGDRKDASGRNSAAGAPDRAQA